jgi:HTH-type transcriptional regulator/antitoxin HigA
VPEIIRYLMDQNGMTKADMIAVLGSPDRAQNVLSGKKPLTMAMVQRLRARFQVSADLLLPPPETGRRVKAKPRYEERRRTTG